MSGKAKGVAPSQPERQKVRHNRKESAWLVDSETASQLTRDVSEQRMEKKILRKVKPRWWVNSGMKVLVDLFEGEGQEMLQ